MIGPKLYAFDELMLWNFIQCLIKSDLSKLKRSKGFIKKSKLARHWEDIFNEYMNRSDDNSQVFMLGALKEYTILTNKIKVVDMSIEQLAKGYNQQIADNLKSIGFPVKKSDDYKTYIAGLKSIQSRAKFLVMRANKLKSEMEAFNEKKGSSEIKESDFNETLLIMSKNQHYQITSKTITVADFILLTKMYKENGERAKGN